MNLRELFSDISSAIKEKDGSSGKICAMDFPSRIRAIQQGSSFPSITEFRVSNPPNKTSYRYSTIGADLFIPDGMTFSVILDAVGITLDVPLHPDYSVSNNGIYSINPSPSGIVTKFPNVPFQISFFPTTMNNESIDNITVTCTYGGQTVTAKQAVTVSYNVPIWSEIDNLNLTWKEVESRYPTWRDMAGTT